jgi:acetyltransferase-like isoleucine patch superfamily enzyme
MIALVKSLTLGLAVLVMALPIGICRIERRLSARDDWFIFFAQAISIVPGFPGRFLRKAYYGFTLDACPFDCDIGFLSWFTHPQSLVGAHVYIGHHVTLGRIEIGDGVMIGNHACFLNGGAQHRFDAAGNLTAFDRDALTPLRIGERSWIGEQAVVMADIGAQCIVGAASVVSSPVREASVVAGNPARFVRRVVIGEDEAALG